MSALPLLSPLPPAPSGAALEKPITTPNTPPTVASDATGDEVLAPAVANDVSAQGSNEGEGGQSFWDTLQEQAASTDPALGQNNSALNNTLSVTANESILDGDAFLVEELNVEDIQVQGLDQSVNEQQAIAPWSMAAIQSSMNQAKPEGSNSAMDQILSQRSAQPQVQAQAGVLTPIELQSKSILDTPLTQGAMAPLITGEMAMAPLITGEMAKAVEPMAGQFMQSSSVETNSLLSKGSAPLSSGVALDQGLLMDEPVNIHEKPITLSMPETLTAATTSQSTIGIQDAALMETVDGLDALQASTGQNTKDLAQGSKVLNSAVQGADKVLAGQAKIDVPPSSPKFTEQIAQRIAIMSSEQLQTARIQLDPPELGSLEIKIRVQQDQVSVAFASGHAVVRDALEAQAPRLREMLEQQGVELTDVNVSDQQKQSTAEGNSEGVAGEGSEDWVDEEMNEETLMTEVQSDSLVDYFA